jgi:hypothetical protein
MSREAHIIDIDTIVLPPGGLHDRDRLAALVEAQVALALAGAGFGASAGLADGGTWVAGEVGRAVVRAVEGGSHAD